MRNLGSVILAALNSDLVRPVFFVEIISSDPIYTHTSVGDIIVDGHTWLGCGNLGAIGNIHDSAEIQAANLDISLTGIPISQRQAVMTAEVQGARVNIYLGVLDENLKLDGSMSLLWTGFVDTAPFTYGKNISATVHCENEMVDWNRPRLRRYNTIDQEKRFPGDKGFEFVALLEDMEVSWGKT